MKERTWLILQRDLSVWLRDVEAATFTTMVLDLIDEGTRAVESGSTVEESLREALSSAAKEPARGMQRAVPDRIQVPNGLAGAMESVLGALELGAGFRPETVIEEVTRCDSTSNSEPRIMRTDCDLPVWQPACRNLEFRIRGLGSIGP